MSLNLFPQQILKINLYLIFFLIFVNALGIISKYYFDHDSVYGFVPLFDFNTEKNIPTLFSSITLIIASILLLSISLTHKKLKSSYIMWFGLSVIFLFLSIDEIHSIHERFGKPTREAFNTSGLLFYAWIIPYGVALVIFIITYSNFLIKLPKNTMILFFVSGVIFILGAIGFEMLGGRQHELYGSSSILYAFYYTCEESLEMIGIAIFIYTLLSYIIEQFESVKIIISKKITK
jgi:hypothetical protein